MSIYREATLGLPDNYITFNNFNNSPVYRTQTRAPQQFQVREDNIPIPFEDGISDFKTLIGKTIYVIHGTMYPDDENTYDTGIQKLRAVCSLEIQENDTYSNDGYVPYTWGEANDNKTLFVKALYVQMIEDTRRGFVQPFTIYCKIKDPTIYGSILKTASTQTSNPVSSGGSAKYPFKYPILFGSTLYTVSSVATNNGTLSAYPFSINIYGPITNPRITNKLTGEYINITATLNSVSDVISINYGKDLLVATLNGNSIVSGISKDTIYFKIKPGDNPIELSGASIGTGAYCVLTYRDAYALA